MPDQNDAGSNEFDLETILAIQEGFESIERGEGRPAREAIEAIRARSKTDQAKSGRHPAA